MECPTSQCTCTITICSSKPHETKFLSINNALCHGRHSLRYFARWKQTYVGIWQSARLSTCQRTCKSERHPSRPKPCLRRGSTYPWTEKIAHHSSSCSSLSFSSSSHVDTSLTASVSFVLYLQACRAVPETISAACRSVSKRRKSLHSSQPMLEMHVVQMWGHFCRHG
jgi:hypothetical protein